MRRALLASCMLAFGVPPAASAAPPTVSATPASGPAPLTVTLTASDPATHWDLGDGTTAEGAVVQHVYAAGAWTAVATAGGEPATVQVEAGAVSLRAPRAGRFGERLAFDGALLPARAGTPVALYSGTRRVGLALAAADGSFRVAVRRLPGPGPYVAKTALASSAPVSVAVHPGLAASFAGTGAVGRPLVLAASLRPASAGALRVRIWKAGRLVADLTRLGSVRVPLDTSRAVGFRAAIAVVPAKGYLGARTALETNVVVPRLQLGSTGPSVVALERRLAAMHYALRGVDGTFGEDTYEAVLAFQKVHGLARTGRVDPPLWQRIAEAGVPPARHPGGDHIEVDKSRQVLFAVRDGEVALVVHVSTGATGNTPVGVWHVYRRVGGFDWVLYYPSYFLRGFAVHGYPSVPPYPASHGCVRIPMWVAERVYSSMWLGEPVYVDA